MPISPLDDPLYAQGLKSWYSSLRDHDPRDVRAHIEGLVCVLGLLASRLPPGPKTTFTDDDFDLKRRMWTTALRHLLKGDKTK